jgi:hypothetical protein
VLFISRKTYEGIICIISVFAEKFAVILTGAGTKLEHPASQFLTLKINPNCVALGTEISQKVFESRKDGIGEEGFCWRNYGMWRFVQTI